MMIKEGIKFYKFANNFRKLKKLNTLSGKKRAARFLCEQMGNEKGIFLKIGQAMGSSAASMEEFKTLTDDKLEALDFQEVKDIIEEAYLLPMEEIFLSFNPVGKIASIGQVHDAVLYDGTHVAVKIQYPYIKNAIQQQLKFLNLIPLKVGPVKKWGIPVNDYLELLWQNMDMELSYLQEIRNQKRYQEIVQGHYAATVADVIDEYSRDHIFFQSWQNGVKINEVCKKWPVENKQKVGKILLESFLIHFFHKGFLQSDPNDGNFLFRLDDDKRPHVVYLDFGSCTEYSEDFRLATLKLIVAAVNKEKIDPLPYLVILGFDETKLKHIHKSLPALVEALFEPFLAPYPYDLSTWELKKQIDLILGEFKWWFRSAGSPHFFMLMKAFIGLVNQLSKLDARLNWNDILFQNVSGLLLRLTSFQIPAISMSGYTFDALAKRLKVSVHEGHTEKANITLPIHALVDLESIMDEEVLKKIRDRNINLSRIITDTSRSGCFPEELFHLVDGNKSVRVWTE